MAYLHSIAREVPAFSVSNEEAAAILEPTFREAGEDLELLRQIFRNAAIDRRYLARPPEFYGETRDLTTRNRVYHEVASELGTRASARANVASMEESCRSNGCTRSTPSSPNTRLARR